MNEGENSSVNWWTGERYSTGTYRASQPIVTTPNARTAPSAKCRAKSKRRARIAKRSRRANRR